MVTLPTSSRRRRRAGVEMADTSQGPGWWQASDRKWYPPETHPLPMPPQGKQPVKRKHRVFTWVILVINVLFLIWVITGVASGSGNATNCGGLSQQTCNDAAHTGTAIGVALIVVFWAIVDVILGVLWLVTRKREPTLVYVQQTPTAQ